MGKYRGKNQYLGAWSYVLLGILYMIPVLGWCIALFHALRAKNENLKHYARALFAFMLLIVLGILAYAAIVYFKDGLDALKTMADQAVQQLQSFVHEPLASLKALFTPTL